MIRKALELDPANRFPNADAMAAALEAAGDVAKPKTVSAWVETVAAELLESRRSMVERVEQLSGSDVAPDVTGGAMPAAGASAPSALTGRASLDAEEATARMPPPELPPSLVAAPAPPPAPPPDAFAPELAPAGVPRRSLVGAIAGGVITLLFLAVGAVFLVRSRPTAAPNPSPTPTTSESVVASPIPPPAVTLGDTSPPAEGPPPVTSAGPSARRGPRPRAAAPSASTRAVPDCSQPFSVDANGTRIPRRECL